MNLRCIYCQTPFSLGRMEKLAAIQKLQAEDMHHYDAFCPRCRRSNPVSIERLQIFTPGWQDGLRTLEADAAQIEQQAAPTPAASAAPKPAATAPARKHHHSKAVALAAKKEAPKKAAKKPAAKPAAKKAAPAPKAKPAAKKPVAKKPAAKPKKK